MNEAPVVSAALAGVPAGIQAQGVWAGRRQLFVRFAGEAETATMYTAAALVRELEKQQSRSAFHSICIGGRDPLANLNFLLAAFDLTQPRIPLMLDTDGQRPEALASLAPHLDLAQVTVEFVGSDANVTRAIETVVAAAAAKCARGGRSERAVQPELWRQDRGNIATRGLLVDDEQRRTRHHVGAKLALAQQHAAGGTCSRLSQHLTRRGIAPRQCPPNQRCNTPTPCRAACSVRLPIMHMLVYSAQASPFASCAGAVETHVRSCQDPKNNVPTAAGGSRGWVRRVPRASGAAECEV